MKRSVKDSPREAIIVDSKSLRRRRLGQAVRRALADEEVIVKVQASVDRREYVQPEHRHLLTGERMGSPDPASEGDQKGRAEY